MGQKSSPGGPDSCRGFHHTGRRPFRLASRFPWWKSVCLAGNRTGLESGLESAPPGMDLSIPAVGECKSAGYIICSKKSNKIGSFHNFSGMLISVNKNSWFSFPVLLNILRELKGKQQTNSPWFFQHLNLEWFCSAFHFCMFGEADFPYSNCSPDVFCTEKCLGDSSLYNKLANKNSFAQESMCCVITRQWRSIQAMVNTKVAEIIAALYV